jgi:hypothetical protein
MNNQIGIQNNNRNPASIPPVRKLIQARYARANTMAPLQNISTVALMPTMYNKPGKDKMGIIPR